MRVGVRMRVCEGGSITATMMVGVKMKMRIFD